MRVAGRALAVGLCSDPLPSGGRSWSLSTVFGQLLQRAQEAYGPRDRSYSFVGVEFGFDGPEIWYPGNRRDVAIVLSAEAAANVDRACFQLAHEVIHLLAPSGTSGAVVFEEGLAAVFSDDMSAKHGWGFYTAPGKYSEAASLVRRVMAAAPSFVVNMRKTKPSFGDWIPDDLLAFLGDAISPQEAATLCLRFATWDGQRPGL